MALGDSNSPAAVAYGNVDDRAIHVVVGRNKSPVAVGHSNNRAGVHSLGVQTTSVDPASDRRPNSDRDYHDRQCAMKGLVH